jgi:diketogulonate reductase-like aldo/keto reductase
MQVHNLVDVDTHLTTLKEWREKKKIKYIGITHYTDDAFGELAKYLKKYPEIDFCQFPYSIARREAEDYFLELCDDLEIATLINRPFEQNDLFVCVQNYPLPEWAIEFGCLSWAQFFLKYILGHKAVTCVIPATSKPNHMADNLVAGTGRLPNINELKRMANYFQAL